MVSTRIKRASLDDAYDAAVAAPIALRVQLRAYETTARSAVSTGQIISQVSARDRSTSFSLPDSELLEGMTPVAMVEMWRELVDLFDYVYAGLGGTPTDQAVKNEMMALLQPAHELQPSNFHSVLCG